MNCECGFSRDACAANPCLRKKVHLAGLTPGSRWPEGAPISQDSKTTGDGTRNGRTTQPELTGSPCGTPQGAGGFIAPADRWVVGKTAQKDERVKLLIFRSHSVVSTMNGGGTVKDMRAETVPSIYYQLDCLVRNEADPTKRMALGLRMGMEREGSTPAFKARQDGILRPRVRVAAKTEVAL